MRSSIGSEFASAVASARRDVQPPQELSQSISPRSGRDDRLRPGIGDASVLDRFSSFRPSEERAN
jgi:hypothetical protein